MCEVFFATLYLKANYGAQLKGGELYYIVHNQNSVSAAIEKSYFQRNFNDMGN